MAHAHSFVTLCDMSACTVMGWAGVGLTAPSGENPFSLFFINNPRGFLGSPVLGSDFRYVVCAVLQLV